MAIGITDPPGLPELFPGTHPFCLRWFPIAWALNPDGTVDYSKPTRGQPIVGWRAWRNINTSFDSTGATPSDPKLGNIPNNIQGICWYHPSPYKTLMGGMASYPLPDGTTRTSGTSMSEQAWGQLSQKVVDDNVRPALAER